MAYLTDFNHVKSKKEQEANSIYETFLETSPPDKLCNN